MKQKMCHCHVLMTKYISKTIDMMDQFVVVRVNYKKHTKNKTTTTTTTTKNNNNLNNYL